MELITTPRTLTTRKGKIIYLDEYPELLAVYNPIEPVGCPCALLPVDARNFEEAGWVLVDRSKYSNLRGYPTAQVFVRGNKMQLAPGRVTVKLVDSASIAFEEWFLHNFRLRVVQRLTFAKNLFVVISNTANPDVIKLVDELIKLDTVEFAEPEFIENLGGRLG